MLKTALVVSLKAVSKIVLICAGGAYLEKTGVLHKEMRKGVSEAFVKLLLPCLLFTRILPTMSVETLPKLGWLAMANLLYVSLGLCIGCVSVLLTKPPRGLRRVLMATPAIGHANSIPFMLVSLIIAEDPAFNPDDTNTAQGYVGLYLVMHSITLWGVGMNVIKKEKEDEPSLAHETTETQTPQTLGRPASISAPSQSTGGLNMSEAREDRWSHSISGLELGSPVTAGGPNTKNQHFSCDPRPLQRWEVKKLSVTLTEGSDLIMTVWTPEEGSLTRETPSGLSQSGSIGPWPQQCSLLSSGSSRAWKNFWYRIPGP